MLLDGYLVIKPIASVGYDLWPEPSDWKNGLREFAFYAPIVLALGFLMSFIHWHGRAEGRVISRSLDFYLLLYRPSGKPSLRVGTETFWNATWKAAGASALLLRSSGVHFNKGAAFNWRYVLLATIAGRFMAGPGWPSTGPFAVDHPRQRRCGRSIWFRACSPGLLPVYSLDLLKHFL